MIEACNEILLLVLAVPVATAVILMAATLPWARPLARGKAAPTRDIRPKSMVVGSVLAAAVALAVSGCRWMRPRLAAW